MKELQQIKNPIKNALNLVQHKIVATNDLQSKIEILRRGIAFRHALKKIESQQKQYDTWLAKGELIKKEEKAFTGALFATVGSLKIANKHFPKLNKSLEDIKNRKLYPRDGEKIRRGLTRDIKLSAEIMTYLREKVLIIVTKFNDLDDGDDQFDNDDQFNDRLELYEAIIAFYELLASGDEAVKVYRRKVADLASVKSNDKRS